MGSNYFLKHTISQVDREKSAEHTLHLLNAHLLRQLGHGEIEQNLHVQEQSERTVLQRTSPQTTCPQSLWNGPSAPGNKMVTLKKIKD